MLFKAGKLVRFRGPLASYEANLFADELHGRCLRVSDHEVRITKPTHYKPYLAVDVLPDSFRAIESGTNGRHDAKPPGRTLGDRS